MPKILESEALTIARSIDQAPETDRPWMLDLLDRYQQQQRDEGEPDWPSVERARVERETNLRGMFESPEKITYDPGPFSQNPQEAKMLHANMALLSARYQKEPAEVASRYDFLLNDYARQKLGASEDVDTAKFYALAQKDMQRVKLREDTQREGMSAALRGEDGVKALAAWQAKNADRAKDDAGLFMRGYQQALEQDGEMLPIADRLLPLLEAGASKREGQVFDQTKAQELGGMIEQLAGMKKAQRKSVYRSIAARIEAAGYDQKGFWSQMLGELDKALYRMEGTIGTSAGIASDVATAVAGAQTRIPDTFDGSSVSMPVLSDEEQQALLRQRDYRERIGNVQEEILQIVSGELDPVRPTLGWLNDTIETGAIKGPGAVAPFMAASALLGPYGAGLVFTADFAEQNRRELVQSGLDADQARKVGAMAAPLQAAVESLSNMVSLGKFPAVQAALSRFTRPVGGASLVGRYVQNSLISLATEFTEEQVQANLIVPVIQEVLGVFETYMPEVDWDFYKTRAANATPELAATLLPMALVFGGVMTAADARLSDRMTSNVDALTALNYSQAQATEIVREKTPEARIAKAASLWRSRAGNKASLEEGAAKLAERLKALSGDAVAYQAELERRGVLPRVMHTAENDWLLTFNDGSTARFATHDEASTARWTWAEDQLGRVHALTREALTSMERNMSTNRELGVEFKPDVRTAQDAVNEGASVEQIKNRVEQGKVLGDISPDTSFEDAQAIDKATTEADGFLSSLRILGSSKNEFKDGILRTTIKLWEGANILTLVEEKLEGDAEAIIMEPKGREWMLSHLRNYEQVSGDKLFRELPDEQLKNEDLVEAWSHLGQSYLVERSSFGEPLQKKAMRRFGRLLMRAGLAGALNSESTFWQAVVNRAQKLRELKAAGKLGADVVAELEKQLGIDSQVKHEQGAMQEAQQVANEVAQQVDTSGYSEANPGPNGETFSIAFNINLAAKQALENETAKAGETLRAFPKLENGLTPDSVKNTPEWKAAKVAYDNAAAKLKAFNQSFLKQFWKEYRAYTDAQKASRATPADASKVVQMPDGARLVGPTTFSIRAHHGTPHKVDKFTTAKIGTGEGAQAYGWGLYFAENQDVAKQYRTILSARDNNLLLDGLPIAKKTTDEERDSASDKAVAQAFYAPLLAGKTPEEARAFLLSMRKDKTWVDALTQFDTSRLSFEKDGVGNLYTVELLPDESDFLDWDKPLSEQSEKVKKGLTAGGVTRRLNDPASVFYEQLAMEEGSEKAASEYLASLGIPGIRYLDGGSRGAGDGTRNYVIFDENLVRILEENGKPVDTSTMSNDTFSMASASGAAQNAEPSPGGLSEAEARRKLEALKKERQRRYDLTKQFPKKQRIATNPAYAQALSFAHEGSTAVDEFYERHPELRPVVNHGTGRVRENLPASDDSEIEEVTEEMTNEQRRTQDRGAAYDLLLEMRGKIRPLKSEQYQSVTLGSFDASAKSDSLYLHFSLTPTPEYFKKVQQWTEDELWEAGLPRDLGDMDAGYTPEDATIPFTVRISDHPTPASSRTETDYDVIVDDGTAWSRGNNWYKGNGEARTFAGAVQNLFSLPGIQKQLGLKQQTPTVASEGSVPVGTLTVADQNAPKTTPSSPEVNPESSHAAGGTQETFSLRTGDFASRVEAMFSPFQRSPEARLIMTRVAKSRALKLGQQVFEASIRTMGSIDREARVRAALAEDKAVQDYLDGLTPAARQTLEWQPADLQDDPLVAAMLDFGKLMSKTTALQRGKLDLKMGDFDGAPWLPPSFYSKGAGIMPDQMAQAMFDAGLLPDAYTDTLWSELAKRIEATRKDKAAHREAVQAFKDAKKAARDAAAKEAGTWADNAKKQAGSAKAQRERIKAWLRVLDGILAASPPEVRARVGGFVKMAGIATDEAALRYLEDRVAKLDKELEKYLVKQARGQLERIFDKARPKSDAGEKAKGKLTPELHAWFKLAEEAAKLSPAVADERIQGIEQSLASDMTDAIKQELSDWLGRPVTDDAEAQTWQETRLTLFQTFGAVMYGTDAKSERNAAEITAALDAAREAYQTGRLAHIEQLAKLREKRAEERGDGIQRVGSPYDPNKANTRKKALNKATGLKGRALDYMDANLDASGFILDLLGDDTTTDLYETTRRNLLEAAAAKADNIEKRKADFAAMLKQVFPGKGLVDRLRGLWELQQIQENAPVGTMSQLQAMQFTLWYLDPDSREWLATNGYGDEWQAKAEQWLTSEAKAVRAWLLKQYDGQYDRLNPVFRRLRGVNLPRVEVYGGKRQIEHSKSDSTASIEADMMRGGMDAGFTKTRVSRPTGRPRMTDALQNYWQNALQVEHYIAFAETVTELKAVFGHRDFLGAVETNRGLAKKQQVLDWISNIETAGTRDAFAHSMQGKLFGRYGKAVSASALLLKLATLAKQAPAAIQSAFKVGLKEYFTSLSRILAGKGAISLGDMYRSDTVQRRLSEHDNEMLQASKGWNQRHFENEILDKAAIAPEVMMNAGWYAMGWTDARFTTISAAVAYDVAFRDGKKLDMSDDEAKAFAANQADLIVMETAQPQDVVTRSLAENMMPQALLRLVFAFQSANRQVFGLTYLAAKRGKVANAYAVAAIIAAMTQTIGGIMRMLFSDDDPEELFDPQAYALGMATAPLTGMVGLGPLVEFGLNFAGVESRFSPSSAAAAKSLQDIVNGEADTKDVGRVVSMAGAALGGRGAMLGVGWNVLNQIMGLYENAADQ